MNYPEYKLKSICKVEREKPVRVFWCFKWEKIKMKHEKKFLCSPNN